MENERGVLVSVRVYDPEPGMAKTDGQWHECDTIHELCITLSQTGVMAYIHTMYDAGGERTETNTDTIAEQRSPWVQCMFARMIRWYNDVQVLAIESTGDPYHVIETEHVYHKGGM